ncbi:hypothetical protein LUZ60_001146 [Juncus effusus]|nr:hypothetical protein LUZ60_001146 [Juncus effusus]
MMLHGRRQQLTADLWARAGELEKQFASYKQKTDQSKDESTFKEKKERKKDARGELYERYMKIRDVKLREGWIAKMERKEEEMAAMWDQLEKTHADMAVRFGGGKVGPVPVRTPSTPLVPKNSFQKKELISEERKGHDLTTRTNITSTTKRQSSISRNSTPSSSNSRPSSTSRTATLPLSPRRSNPHRAQTLPRVESPSRSPVIFKDSNKTPTPPTPRSTRVLTKSQSSIMEKSGLRGAQKPPRVSSIVTPRVSRSGSFDYKLDEMLKDEMKLNDQIAFEEALKDEIMETSFKSIITTDDDDLLPLNDDLLPLNDGLLPSNDNLLSLNDNYTGIVINKENEEEEEEIRSVRSSLSHHSSNHLEPDSTINIDTAENSESFTPDQQVETETETYDLVNQPIDKTEVSSNESTRSWYSNLESSFSNRSTVDPAIDSPILSPRGSSSFRFMPEPTPIRMRKKWEARSTNSPRGIKKLLSFGRRNRGSETLSVDSTTVLDDESSSGVNGINRMSWVSNDSNGSRVSESENGERASVYQPGMLDLFF